MVLRVLRLLVAAVVAMAIPAAPGPVLAGPPPVPPPVVGPAVPVSDPVYQRPAQGREAGDVAPGPDGGYLLVWEDFRTFETGGHSEIYAARMASDGTVLDPAGIRVTSAPQQQTMPSVAWTGSGYLVVWTDYRNKDEANSGTDVYGARLAADGEVLDPDGILLAGGVGDQSDADVAWNGSAFVVAWTTPGANGTDVWIRRLTPELASIGPDGLPFAAASYSQGHVSLATDGTSVVGIYDDDRDSDIGEGTNVYMNILDENGGMLDDGFAIATGAGDQRAGDVAASPAGVLATWTSYDTGASGVEPRPMARRFQGTSPSGQVQELAPSGRASTVAWGADGYLVAWSEVADDRSDVVGRTVSIQVVLGDPFPITDDAASEDVVAVAASGSDYLVAATDKPSTGGAGRDVLAIRVADAAALDDPPLRPAKAARPQESPVVAEAGGTRVAVWAEQDETTGWDVWMGRIADDGSLLDGVGLPVATGPDDERLPSVAWNGSRLLVAWFELGAGAPQGRIVARPFNPAGTALGPLVELGQGVLDQRPGVASNDAGFAVGWGRQLIQATSEPQVQLLDGGGAKVGGPLALADLAISPLVSVAALGGGYVATWSAARIEARRIGATGTLLDAAPIVLSDSPGELYEDAPSVASSGNQVLVAWIQRPGSAIQAARLDGAGTVLDPEPIGLTPVDPSVDPPTVGWNGVAYLVAWWHLDGLVTLAGAEVNRLGAVLESSTLAVVPHMTPGGGPPLVAAGSGSRNTIGYSALDLAAPGGGAPRAYVRSIALDTQAPTTTAPGYAFVTGALGAGTRPPCGSRGPARTP